MLSSFSDLAGKVRAEFLAISEEKTVDYGGYICAHFGFCLFGGAFSSDYIP